MSKIIEKLKLERPICFIDLETTGLSREEDRIIQIAICKVNVDGTREVKTKYINPEMEISAESTEVTGITNEMVANEPTFKRIAKGLHGFIEGCDIGGFNSNTFDVPLLFNEFQRANIYWDYKSVNLVDVGNIFKINAPRTLEAAVLTYTGKEMVDQHNAEADILATIEVFEAQLDKHEDIPSNMTELMVYCNYGKEIIDITGKFSKNDDGELIFNFGKHKGQVAKTEPDFLKWMVEKAKFSQDVKEVAEKLLNEIEGQ